MISIILADSYPIIRQSLNLEYNYEVFWGYRQRTANLIKKLTLPNEPILIYPHDVDFYALSQRLPPDKFVYWFPWIDSVEHYRLVRLQSVNQDRSALILVGNLDFKGTPNYYLHFFPNLTAGYSPVIFEGKQTGLFLRNDLVPRLSSL